ncbi:MAG TPA: cation diffusion facilitator family transporter [Candidatus Sulfotelmatobacter sp.]|nr:cation diffusion facilitator family transporter [Candidatus Sulfotelmatobacter sp.]
MDALRARSVARVLWSILGLNVLVAAAKLAYGYRSHAIAISADGLHSLIDGMSNIVGLVGLQVASRPPDANHPYGHRKYETFAAMGVAALLFVGCREILGSSLERLRHPRLPEVGAAGYLVLFVTITINLVVVIYERRAAHRLNSELLLSDAAHTGSDVLASVLVLVSFALAPLRHRWVDLAAALVIVGLILRSGWEILRSTLSTLSDERRIDPALVEAAALEVAGVREAHNVRSRGPHDDIHLDLHVLVDPGMPIAAAHALSHSVEQRLRSRWQGLTDVVVHVEPALDSERATHSEGGGLKAEG